MKKLAVLAMAIIVLSGCGKLGSKENEALPADSSKEQVTHATSSKENTNETTDSIKELTAEEKRIDPSFLYDSWESVDYQDVWQITETQLIRPLISTTDSIEIIQDEDDETHFTLEMYLEESSVPLKAEIMVLNDTEITIDHDQAANTPPTVYQRQDPNNATNTTQQTEEVLYDFAGTYTDEEHSYFIHLNNTGSGYGYEFATATGTKHARRFPEATNTINGNQIDISYFYENSTVNLSFRLLPNGQLEDLTDGKIYTKE